MSMHRKKNSRNDDIEPGMIVEATRGDLGEEDVSKPKVAEVVEGEQGKVEKLIVEKGFIFRKKLEIPANRIKDVEREAEENQLPGKVTVEVSKDEAKSLKSIGVEELAPESQGDVLDTVERKVPTAEGVREMEASNATEQAEIQSSQTPGEAVEDIQQQQITQPQPLIARNGIVHLLHTSYLTLMTVIGIMMKPTVARAVIPAIRFSLFDNTGSNDTESSDFTLAEDIKRL